MIKPTFILLVASITLQISSRLVFSNEILDGSFADNHNVELSKRHLGALAKNKQLPPVQQRSVIPPVISKYRLTNRHRIPFENELDAKEKRNLQSLARNGDLNKQQKKASIDPITNEEIFDDIRYANKEDIPNPMILKQDMINNLRPVILDYLSEFNKKYDPRKVDLFLENLANAIYDQNEEVSMESIRALVQSDYFQPEEIPASYSNNFKKRNIQSVARDSNKSSGTFISDLQSGRSQFYGQDPYDLLKRNLESVIKNQIIKRYLGAMAKNKSLPPKNTGKRNSDDSFEFSNDDNNDDDDDEDEEYLRTVGKRHTMYDINEPDITFEYPSQAGEQADYNDYAEQDATISIGKRYLGALARNGWLPQEFAHRSMPASNSAFESKRHIAALARLGYSPSRSTGTGATPPYYFRGGRGRDFQQPTIRGPRAMMLKAVSQDEGCKCKRSADSSWTPSSWRTDLRGSNSGPSTTSGPGMLARQTSSLLNKKFLLVPAVNHFLLQKIYPHLLPQQNI